MLTLGELNILEKSRSVHSLHACVIMVDLKIYHIEHFTLQVQIIISGLPINAFDFFPAVRYKRSSSRI